MRYVPSLCLRNGMILGKNIYGDMGQLLLKVGVVLNDNYIESIKSMGFSGVYIDDDLSHEIEVVSVVNDDLRQKTVKGVKELFIAIDADDKGKHTKMETLKEQLYDILEEVLNNKKLMINMVDLKFFDNYTYQHSVNVAILSMIFGTTLNLGRESLYKLGLAGLLHDIGKVFIDKSILNKPGKLTDEEFVIMKNHAKLGYDYLKKEFNFPTTAYLGALDHHEKIDGTGYPNKKNVENISLFGKIISIADVYDALTAERPYRSGMLPSEAIEFLMAGSGTHFDHELVTLFVKKIAAYPVGTCILLTNGYKAIVVNNFEDACLRPAVKVFEIDGEAVEPFIINLREDKNYLNTTIKSIIKE